MMLSGLNTVFLTLLSPTISLTQRWRPLSSRHYGSYISVLILYRRWGSQGNLNHSQATRGSGMVIGGIGVTHDPWDEAEWGWQDGLGGDVAWLCPKGWYYRHSEGKQISSPLVSCLEQKWLGVSQDKGDMSGRSVVCSCVSARQR